MKTELTTVGYSQRMLSDAFPHRHQWPVLLLHDSEDDEIAVHSLLIDLRENRGDQAVLVQSSDRLHAGVPGYSHHAVAGSSGLTEDDVDLPFAEAREELSKREVRESSTLELRMSCHFADLTERDRLVSDLTLSDFAHCDCDDVTIVTHRDDEIRLKHLRDTLPRERNEIARERLRVDVDQSIDVGLRPLPVNLQFVVGVVVVTFTVTSADLEKQPLFVVAQTSNRPSGLGVPSVVDDVEVVVDRYDSFALDQAPLTLTRDPPELTLWYVSTHDDSQRHARSLAFDEAVIDLLLDIKDRFTDLRVERLCTIVQLVETSSTNRANTSICHCFPSLSK